MVTARLYFLFIDSAVAVSFRLGLTPGERHNLFPCYPARLHPAVGVVLAADVMSTWNTSRARSVSFPSSRLEMFLLAAILFQITRRC
jgi:hypothetical protein